MWTPWLAAEVPVGAWIRNKVAAEKGHTDFATIIGVTRDYIMTTEFDVEDMFIPLNGLEAHEYSIDKGVTWHQCGNIN